MSWVSETCERIASLRGVRVARATIVEMSLVEHGPDGLPVFRHAMAPFVQAIKIELGLDDGRFAVFSNYQNDTDFPISMELLPSTSIATDYADVPHDGEPSIFRVAPALNFPVGLVSAVETRLNNNGDIFEVAITVDNIEVVLRAGEVIEDAENTFSFCDMAGAIFIFLSAKDYARVELNKKLTWS